MIVCDAFGGKWTKSQARRGRSSSSTMSIALPRGPRSFQTASFAFRTNQPSPFGTRPCSLGSSRASGTIGPYTDRDGNVVTRCRPTAPAGVDEGARAERGLEVLRRQEADPRRLVAHDLRGGAL